MKSIEAEMKTSVKVIGANGQISLGKEYAGRQILVEERGPGVWMIRTAVVVPENEAWLHTPEVKAALARSFAWMAANPATETDVDAFFDKLEKKRDKQAKLRHAARQA